MPRSHRRRANSRGEMLGFPGAPAHIERTIQRPAVAPHRFRTVRPLLSGSINRWVLTRGSTAKTIYCQDDLQPRDLGIVHVSADRGNCWARRRSTSGPLAGSRRVSIEFPRAFLRRPHRCAVIAERQRRREGPRVYLSAMPGCAVSDRPRPLLGMMTFRRR